MNVPGFEEIVEIEYTSEHDRAIYTMFVGFDLERLYKKDVETLEDMLTREKDEERIEAMQAILESLRTSLEKGIGNNPAYTKANTYESIAPGIKVHKETGDVYICGMVTNKEVLEVIKDRKPVNSARKTIVKNQVRRELLLSAMYREFKIAQILEADGI
jgi:hypothetical protein